jgi:hypothetical protein
MVAIGTERGAKIVWMGQVDFQGVDLRQDPARRKANSFKAVIPKLGRARRKFEQMNDGPVLQLEADGEDRRWLAVAAVLVHKPNQSLTYALSPNQPRVIPQLEIAFADHRPYRIGKRPVRLDREVGD